MTLIITELSEFGIAMVADSAITYREKTPTGDDIQRVLSGARKLQVIPYLNTAISMWGLGSIETPAGPVSTDVWIDHFIGQHADIRSIDDFANLLAQELQQAVGVVEEPIGFHLPGYVEEDGAMLTTFYHVRNVDGTYGNFKYHDFIPGQDIPPQDFKGKIHRTRNGDFGPYAVLADAVEKVLPKVAAIGLTIPYPSLHGRVRYLIAWLRFVSDLYTSSGKLPTIGGRIAALGITSEGQVLSYPT